MAIFPEHDDDAFESFLPDEGELFEEELPPRPYGVTWEFDFARGDIRLNAQGETTKVSGNATVREWVQHALSIRRDESPIYGTDVGTDIPDLARGREYGFLLDLISWEVEEALDAHDRIDESYVSSMTVEGDALAVTVVYTTDDSDEAELTITAGV